MSSRMRVTKGHTRNRRSHHALSEVRLSDCSNCKEKHQRHKVCLHCGFYKGNQVLDVKKKNKIVKTVENNTEEKKTITDNQPGDIKNNAPEPVKKFMKKVQNKG